MTGYETLTASTFLESTMCESGIGVPLIHDKYNYCHGRGTLNFRMKNELVFFRMDNELDKLFEDNLIKLYKKTYFIDRSYKDDIVNDFYATWLGMNFTYALAKVKNKDISNVEISDVSDICYLFKGKM